MLKHKLIVSKTYFMQNSSSTEKESEPPSVSNALIPPIELLKTKKSLNKSLTIHLLILKTFRKNSSVLRGIFPHRRVIMKIATIIHMMSSKISRIRSVRLLLRVG